MNAAVLFRNSARSGTCSQRITALAKSCASVCLSSKVPSAAYTSIIGMAGPLSGHLDVNGVATDARLHRARGGTDRVEHDVGVREHGDVAAVGGKHGGAHAVRHKTLEVGMDRSVVVGHDVPARLRP